MTMDGHASKGAHPILAWILRAVAILVIVGTLLSMTDLNQWWIRIWDFPRMQLLIVMAVLALALWFIDRAGRPWLPLALLALSIWQITRIVPYTSFASTEVERVAENNRSDDLCFTTLVINVLQENRDYTRTENLIRRIDPDIVLLMETDGEWLSAMQPVLAGYPQQISRPLDNTYGLHFATRLPMRDAIIRDLAQEDTPSVFATLTAGGQDFRVIGLHPRPPHPGQDTEERDAEIIVAAKEAQELDMPALAIGDFNDVAWSDTTRLFRKLGNFLDPRVGRGTFATFPADMVWLGWPLDHVFVTEEFLLSELNVEQPVGSDHRPITARMCLAPGTAEQVNAEPESADAGDEEDADEVMDDFTEDEAQDRVEGE